MICKGVVFRVYFFSAKGPEILMKQSGVLIRRPGSLQKVFLILPIASFCVSALFCSSVSAAEQSSGGDIVLPAEVTRASYRSEAGTDVRLYRSEESARWVMTLQEQGSQPITFTLEGQPSSLKPASLDFAVSFDGQPMNVTADGSRLYARVTREGKTLECLRDAKGARTAVDGECSSGANTAPEEMESAMMLNEVAGRWEVMKQMVVSVDTNGLAIGNGSDAASKTHPFTRTGILSEQETKLMEDKLAAHTELADGSSAFLDREQKPEGEK